MKERIEEIKKELEHLRNIVKNARPNSDAYDFEYYNISLLQQELKELEEKEKE